MCFILIGISFYVSNGFEYIYQISNSIYFVLQFLRAEMLQLWQIQLLLCDLYEVTAQMIRHCELC